MKVAIVADFLTKLGGAERVVDTLLEMFPDADIFTLLYDEQNVGRIFPRSKIKESSLDRWPAFLRMRYKYFFPMMPSLVERLDLTGYDLVISSSSAYAHGVITDLDTKHIVYCHSPMRYAWDYTHHYLQEQDLNFITRAIAGYFLKKIREWDFVAAQRADLFIANSKHVQRRIEKYYRRESEVVYPPVDIERFSVHKTHEDYFLIISTLTPYKKIDLAVRLFNKIRRKLVIIGDGSARASLEAIAGDTIDFLGTRTDQETVEYMQNCRAFIFPGEEDFGIAPVEAMACGKPVLAFKRGGLLESMIEGKTGEFFTEQTVESMEDALGRLQLNEKFYKPGEIRAQAEEFSKEKFMHHMKRIIARITK